MDSDCSNFWDEGSMEAPSKKRKKKKKKKKPFEANHGLSAAEEKDESSSGISFDGLVEAFSSSVSVAEDDDVNGAVEILSGGVLENGSHSQMSTGLSHDLNGRRADGVIPLKEEANCMKRRKQRNVASASTGMVSTVIGKGYLGTKKKASKTKLPSISNEEAEQFLYSMLGYECQLNMGVIRDVFCQCGYDVEKALDSLLELSASPYDKFEESSCGSSSQNLRHDMGVFLDRSGNDLADGIKGKCEALDSLLELSASPYGKFEESSCGSSSQNHRHDMGIFPDRSGNDLADGIKGKCELTDDSKFPPCIKELHEVFEPAGNNCGNSTALVSSSEDYLLSTSGMVKSHIPQKVLELLYNIPASSECKPNTMDWKKVVKKMESFGHGLEFHSSRTANSQQSTIHAKGDDYQLLRKSARQHWDAMKSYYQKAAAAYSRGEWGHATYLSEQGKFYSKQAHWADEKASQEIFQARNQGIQNAVTIDMHGQHVKEAIRLLKIHLIVLAYVPSVQFLNVITGFGAHGVAGRGRLKQSVISLLEKEGIEWTEGNAGTVVIRLNGCKEFSFLESEGDSE